MTRRRRITRILSAVLLVAAPACATSVEDPGVVDFDAHAKDASSDTTTTAWDSGLSDSTVAQPDTSTGDDTGIVPTNDTGSTSSCPAMCASDTDCASCPDPGAGNANCCDPGSGQCFIASSGTCGGTTTGDDGGTATDDAGTTD